MLKLCFWFVPLTTLVAPLTTTSLTALADEPTDAAPERAALFKQLDADGDGQIAKDEVSDDHRRLFGRLLRRGDSDGDGELSLAEFTSALADERPETTPRPADPKPADPKPAEQRPVEREAARFRAFLQADPEQLFKRFDANGDGQIEVSEVPQPARGRIERLLQSSDANRDQSLSVEEFRQGHEALRAQAGTGQPNPTQPRGLLGVLDTDGDGKLSKEEIGAASESLSKLDRDEDGEVSQRELMAVFAPQPAQVPSAAGAKRPDGSARPEPARLLERLRSMDADGDGKWSEEELPPFLRQQFGRVDANKDGLLDAEELRQALPALRRPGQ